MVDARCGSPKACEETAAQRRHPCLPPALDCYIGTDLQYVKTSSVDTAFRWNQ